MFIRPVLYLLFAILYLANNVYSQQTSCPPNLDFENGTLDNWEFYTGICCPTNTAVPGAAINGRHTLMSGAGLDPYGNFPVVPPNGGQYSLRLGNNSTGAQAERARYYVQVPANPNSIYTLTYSYAVVLQNPGHTQAEQPRFEVAVFDSATGLAAPCNQFDFVASAGLPGFRNAANGVVYKPWATASIDLSAMAGKTVAIDFTSGDCSQGGHFGYAYIDVACNFYQSYTLHCPDQPTYTLEGPPGFSVYEWRDNSNNIIGNTQRVTIPTPASSSTFSLIVLPYSGFGCPDTIYSSFTITNMTVDISLDTAVCAGESVQLSSGTNSSAGPYTYEWTPPAGLSCSNCDDPIATPAAFTKYYIKITDKDGCHATDSVIVRVDEQVVTNIKVDDTFCSSTIVPIINDFSNPSSAQYLWNVNENGGNITNGISTPAIDALWHQSGTKKIKLKIINGRCSAEDSTTIEIERTPQTSFEVFKNECAGIPVQLHPNFEPESEYLWEIDEHQINETGYVETLYLLWNTIGQKKIKLTTKNHNGCFSSKETFIGIQPYPVASIKAVNADNLCQGKTFELEATHDYRYDYSWRPPQYFDDNVTSKVTGIAEKSGYVYVDVTNQWDCMITDSFWVNGDPCCDIFMPDAFTPDNNSINDTYWSPDLDKHTLVVFIVANRRGQIVYETNTQGRGWDGTFKGAPAPQDTYTYYIKYLCNNKDEMTKKGTVILMR